MDILPTPAGTYVIGPIMRYHTPSWGYSKIRWGTVIKDSDLEKSLSEMAKKDVWYKLSKEKHKTKQTIITPRQSGKLNYLPPDKPI